MNHRRTSLFVKQKRTNGWGENVKSIRHRGRRTNVSVSVYSFRFPSKPFYLSCLLFVISLSRRSYLDLDISFSGEQAELYMQKAIVMGLSAVDTLKRLFFVGNVFDSLKVRKKENFNLILCAFVWMWVCVAYLLCSQRFTSLCPEPLPLISPSVHHYFLSFRSVISHHLPPSSQLSPALELKASPCQPSPSVYYLRAEDSAPK